MFYSHDSRSNSGVLERLLLNLNIVLTSREGGIATVWCVLRCRNLLPGCYVDPSRLVATLGSKTNNKKVNRKSILEVDVKKTCDIIIQPEAPMALRLQGNLLYFSFVLLKLQQLTVHFAATVSFVSIPGSMSTYFRTPRPFKQTSERSSRPLKRLSLIQMLEKRGEYPAVVLRGPPADVFLYSRDQLMIQDDPAFLPDLALPGLDVDLSALAISTDGSSRPPSILSQRSQRSSLSSGHEPDDSMLGLIIPSSAPGGSGGIGGFQAHSGIASSTRGSLGVGHLPDNDEDFNIDLGFGFDEEGNMFEDPLPTERANLTGNVRVESDSATGARVRQGFIEGMRLDRVEVSTSMM